MDNKTTSRLKEDTPKARSMQELSSLPVVAWNADYDVYECVHSDPCGYTEIFKDSHDARKYAQEHRLKFIKHDEVAIINSDRRQGVFAKDFLD